MPQCEILISTSLAPNAPGSYLYGNNCAPAACTPRPCISLIRNLSLFAPTYRPRSLSDATTRQTEKNHTSNNRSSATAGNKSVIPTDKQICHFDRSVAQWRILLFLIAEKPNAEPNPELYFKELPTHHTINIRALFHHQIQH